MSNTTRSDLETAALIKEAVKAYTDDSAASCSVHTSTITKLNESAVLKAGRHAFPFEANTLRFLAANSKVPVPKVFSSYEDPETGVSSIVMELIPGITLTEALPGLSLSEKSEVERQLRDAVAELRRLPSPGYIGSVDRGYCADGTFYDASHGPGASGPFASIEDMIEGMLLRLKDFEPTVVCLIRRWMLADLTRARRIVFTHGDLQPDNVMVARNTDANGESRLDVKIINWETSGWYPEYWEYATSERSARAMTADCDCDWWNMMTRVVPVYRLEQGLLQRYWGLVRTILQNISAFEQQCQAEKAY